MPLVSIGQELERAQKGRYALPLFDTFDMRSTDGMFLALEEKRAPAMVAIYSEAMERPNSRAFAAYIRVLADQANVPVSLMLDHGSSFEQCMKAISYRFTDVMYDGSRLPLAENIDSTRAVVRAAHAVGVCVEAELGHVGSGSEYQSFGAQRSGFTDPDSVERFVEETGVDFLAIAIGTAHGLYDGEPQLDIDLLREIRARVDIPLVLHGGSGLSESQFRTVIAAGISKINVATDLFVTAGKRLVEMAQIEDASYFAMGEAAVDSFQERCGYYLDLFGASGQA
jgi:fructose-bisphosphate aldolase class II